MTPYAKITVGEIHLDCKQTPRKNGKQVLTARDGEGKTVKCDKIDLFDAVSRERFAKDLGNQAEGDTEAIEAALMQLAADLGRGG